MISKYLYEQCKAQDVLYSLKTVRQHFCLIFDVIS